MDWFLYNTFVLSPSSCAGGAGWGSDMAAGFRNHCEHHGVFNSSWTVYFTVCYQTQCFLCSSSAPELPYQHLNCSVSACTHLLAGSQCHCKNRSVHQWNQLHLALSLPGNNPPLQRSQRPHPCKLSINDLCVPHSSVFFWGISCLLSSFLLLVIRGEQIPLFMFLPFLHASLFALFSFTALKYLHMTLTLIQSSQGVDHFCFWFYLVVIIIIE